VSTIPDDVARLYVSLGRLDRSLRRDGESAPVGNGALSALATLAARGPQRLGTLAATEGVSPPSMTRIVASLEKLGHVRRVPDPVDGRAAIVEATTTGEQLVLTGRSVRMQALRARVDQLPDDQRTQLLAAVAALEALVDLDVCRN
jgi:DNA-binding MarR family transcriptional regulator